MARPIPVEQPVISTTEMKRACRDDRTVGCAVARASARRKTVRLARKDEAGPEAWRLRQRRAVGADRSGAQRAQDGELRAAQRPALRRAPRPPRVELAHHLVAHAIGDVPLRGDDGARPRRQEGAGEADHAVALDRAERGPAGAQHDEVGVEPQVVDLVGEETAVAVARRMQREERRARRRVAHHAVGGEVEDAATRQPGADGGFAGVAGGQQRRPGAERGLDRRDLPPRPRQRRQRLGAGLGLERPGIADQQRAFGRRPRRRRGLGERGDGRHVVQIVRFEQGTAARLPQARERQREERAVRDDRQPAARRGRQEPAHRRDQQPVQLAPGRVLGTIRHQQPAGRAPGAIPSPAVACTSAVRRDGRTGTRTSAGARSGRTTQIETADGPTQ